MTRRLELDAPTAGLTSQVPSNKQSVSISPQEGLSTKANRVSKTFWYNDGSPAASKNGTRDSPATSMICYGSPFSHADLLIAKRNVRNDHPTQLEWRVSHQESMIINFGLVNIKSACTRYESNALQHVQLSSLKPCTVHTCPMLWSLLFWDYLWRIGLVYCHLSTNPSAPSTTA